MKRNFKVIVMTLAILATMTGCGSNVQTDNSAKTTTQVSVTTKTEVAPTDSSETDTSDTDFTDSKSDSESKTDTTDDSKSDSSSDESKSEKAATTTKTSESKNESEKAVTTTKQSSTTTSAVATQPVATKATAKPIVTTKATTKAIMKETTRVTTKATRQTNSSFTIPSNATTLQKALYEIFMRHNVAVNAKIAQQEFIKYGKQKMPNYKTSAYMHPFVDKNGKYSDVYNPNYEYADGVEFYRLHQLQSEDGVTSSKAWEYALFEESQIKRDIDNHAYNLKTSSYPNEILWYVTVGVRGNDVDVVVLNGSTFDWKY